MLVQFFPWRLWEEVTLELKDTGGDPGALRPPPAIPCAVLRYVCALRQGVIQDATKLGKTARETKLKQAGLYLPEFPYYAMMSRCAARPKSSSLNPAGLGLLLLARRYFPGFNEATDFAGDVMHIEGDGIAGAELYQFLNVSINKRKVFTLDWFNRQKNKMPASTWGDGQAPRDVHNAVLRRTKGGK